LALIALGFVAGQLFTAESTADPAPVAGVSGPAIPVRSDGSSILADVAERVSPAVVLIRTERAVGGDTGRSDGPWQLFREYFRNDPHARRFHDQGSGSGFVIDREGHILTNHHVVRGADRVTVFIGGDHYEAHVVGTDPLTDIAVIQISPPDHLTWLELGNSDDLRVGDWVMAIGTPFGELQGSVTAGIVSALGRSDLNIMGGTAIYQNYIQTDASINFGNSGGPLVNLRGQVVGISTAINPSGQGIGFAIPINMARRIVGQLIENGRVSYGYMGIGLQALTKELAEGRGLKVDTGIMVTQVIDDTPAREAGLEKGDVIVRYDGNDVKNESAFRMMVANTPVGTDVPIVLLRNGKRKKLDIRIGERPQPEAVASAEPAPGASDWLGLHVDDANRQENRRRYALPGGQTGVVVVGVDKGSPAESAGLREGDVITEVYTHDVKGLPDYVKVARTLKDRKAPIAFLVRRDRSTSYVTVSPDGK